MLGSWRYSIIHDAICKVVDAQTLWGETIYLVWLPVNDELAQVPASKLKPLDSECNITVESIVHISAAARILDSLTEDVILAPIAASVIPLPHQLLALSKAVMGAGVRYLLADEVGLGKTIEAGLILRELKLRGSVQRILVLAPKGLVTQWVSEMRFHFGEEFQAVLPEDIKTLQRIVPNYKADSTSGVRANPIATASNPWQMFSQVVVPVDAFKPLERRRGWSRQQLEAHNSDRYESLITAGWDLIIVDEAHRLGGSTDQVARYKLGRGLADASPYLLLLSATPHQGKTDAFHRLMSLLDEKAFPDVASITRERVQPYVIRTEKRRAIDAEGKPLFKPRTTILSPVEWKDRHLDQQQLYDAVTEYVREGYNRAIKEKRNYIGFLLVLMQRLLVSSTKAIRTTLGRRLEVLQAPSEQLALFPSFTEDDWADLDGQEQVDALLGTRLKALKNERAEVELLLEVATRCEQAGPDAKAEVLLDWLYRLQSEEGDSELKVLIFTEFVPTQEMLQQFLTDRGFTVTCLNGSMTLEERERVQAEFANDTRILVSTDAGGEGLNLQFCHVVINYDIPWNPMRLEQRIGRVDRIGQKHVVKAINLVFENSVEHRVREVLEKKLAVIYEEFGIDKTGDVLDSGEAGKLFDDVYVEALLNPDDIEASVELAINRLKDAAEDARNTASILGVQEAINPGEAMRFQNHPFSHWVERMTINALLIHGGKAIRKDDGWELTWPNGDVNRRAVFSGKESDRLPKSRHLTLEDPRIRNLLDSVPRFVPGQAIPTITLPGISGQVRGYWSIWQISLGKDGYGNQRMLPLFLADDQRVLPPTARHLWEQLLSEDPRIVSWVSGDDATSVLDTLRMHAEKHGRLIYEALKQKHESRLKKEREKATFAFDTRRKTIHKLGLPEVRDYRLKALASEELAYEEKLKSQSQVYPEMTPLLVLRIEVNADE